MPKNTVSDPITDQEMAFAHLVLSGTMNDRRAAEAVGLNPDTAAYTKSKPRVRAFMIEHRAAVREAGRPGSRGIAQAEPWSRPDPGSALGTGQSQPRTNQRQHRRPDQGPFDDRSHRRNDSRPPLSPSETQPTAPPVKAEIYTSQWLRKQQHQAAGEEPGDTIATEAQPGENQVPEPSPTPPLERNHPSPANHLIIPEAMMRVPAATDRVFDAVLDTTSSLRLPFSTKKGPLSTAAEVDKRLNFIQFHEMYGMTSEAAMRPRNASFWFSHSGRSAWSSQEP